MNPEATKGASSAARLPASGNWKKLWKDCASPRGPGLDSYKALTIALKRQIVAQESFRSKRGSIFAALENVSQSPSLGTKTHLETKGFLRKEAKNSNRPPNGRAIAPLCTSLVGIDRRS
jgi:hypothetical protein